MTPSLLPMSMICARQRPNSSMIMDSVSASETPRRSLSSACASMHWQLASTTSGVMKLNGCLRMGRESISTIIPAGDSELNSGNWIIL